MSGSDLLRWAGHAGGKAVGSQLDRGVEAVLPPDQHVERLIAIGAGHGPFGSVICAGHDNQTEIRLLRRDAQPVKVPWAVLGAGIARADHDQELRVGFGIQTERLRVAVARVELERVQDFGVVVVLAHQAGFRVGWLHGKIEVGRRADPVAEQLDRVDLALLRREQVPIAVVALVDVPSDFARSGQHLRGVRAIVRLLLQHDRRLREHDQVGIRPSGQALDAVFEAIEAAGGRVDMATKREPLLSQRIAWGRNRCRDFLEDFAIADRGGVGLAAGQISAIDGDRG